jgi:hypothetical protein
MSTKNDQGQKANVSRRNILLGGTTLAATSAMGSAASIQLAQAQQPAPPPSGRRPNILVIFGDDIGQTNISAYSFGVMGYKPPNLGSFVADCVKRSHRATQLESNMRIEPRSLRTRCVAAALENRKQKIAI